MNEHRKYQTFEEDGTRPIQSGDIEVADTFEEDGIRPIAKSPDYLVIDRTTENNQSETSSKKKFE
jgi:hypothetical protein